jgi:hypothetical protein
VDDTPTYLRNHEAVTRVFGYWPSFHDSPVLSFQRQPDQAAIELDLHVFESSGKSDAKGYHILQKHHIVRFLFTGITHADLEHFIPENILFDLGFSLPSEFEAAGRFTVTLDSAMGSDLCGSFVATAGEVISVLPCDENARSV